MLKKIKCSPKSLLDFRITCRDSILAVISKMLKKSPLSYSMTKHLQFLDPSHMINKPKTAANHLKSALILANHCPLTEVDDVLEEYDKLLTSIKTNNTFLNFNPNISRVDSLFYNEIANNDKYTKLWAFVKKCMVVSHGQATVERGFSENKMVLETNMGEKTLVARRTIKDYIRYIGGVEKFSISDELTKSCSLAHRRYKAYLEEKRTTVVKSGKRKLAEEEVVGLKKRKVELEKNAAYLRTEYERKSDKADNVSTMKEQLALFTSANALRKCAKQKEEEEIASISKEIEEKEAAIKLM